MPSNAWDRSQVREWITAREDELARFAGHQMPFARLSGLIEGLQRSGAISDAEAQGRLDDLYSILDLVRIGRRNTGILRNPPPEVEVLFMTGAGREA
jgi:hypothetical protein